MDDEGDEQFVCAIKTCILHVVAVEEAGIEPRIVPLLLC